MDWKSLGGVKYRAAYAYAVSMMHVSMIHVSTMHVSMTPVLMMHVLYVLMHISMILDLDEYVYDACMYV